MGASRFRWLAIMLLGGRREPKPPKILRRALAPYYNNLEAQVTVTKYTANKVLVLGAVERPGVVTFDGTPTLLEAFRAAVLRPSEAVGQNS